MHRTNSWQTGRLDQRTAAESADTNATSTEGPVLAPAAGELLLLAPAAACSRCCLRAAAACSRCCLRAAAAACSSAVRACSDVVLCSADTATLQALYEQQQQQEEKKKRAEQKKKQRQKKQRQK